MSEELRWCVSHKGWTVLPRCCGFVAVSIPFAALRDVPEVRELVNAAERASRCAYVQIGVRDVPPDSCGCDECRLAAALAPFRGTADA